MEVSLNAALNQIGAAERLGAVRRMPVRDLYKATLFVGSAEKVEAIAALNELLKLAGAEWAPGMKRLVFQDRGQGHGNIWYGSKVGWVQMCQSRLKFQG